MAISWTGTGVCGPVFPAGGAAEAVDGSDTRTADVIAVVVSAMVRRVRRKESSTGRWETGHSAGDLMCEVVRQLHSDGWDGAPDRYTVKLAARCQSAKSETALSVRRSPARNTAPWPSTRSPRSASGA